MIGEAELNLSALAVRHHAESEAARQDVEEQAANRQKILEDSMSKSLADYWGAKRVKTRENP